MKHNVHGSLLTNAHLYEWYRIDNFQFIEYHGFLDFPFGDRYDEYIDMSIPMGTMGELGYEEKGI